METKLKIEHLTPYFPYGLQCQVKDMGKKTIAELNGIYSDGKCTFHHIVESEKGFSEIRPILSSLYDFKDINGNEMNGLGWDLPTQIELCEFANKERGLSGVRYVLYKEMCKNFIDFNGLIEKGLAVDVKTVDVLKL